MRNCCTHLYHGQRGYMLGDLMKQSELNPSKTNQSNPYAKWSDVRRDHRHDFPHSLAAEFVRRTSKRPMSAKDRWHVLYQIVAERRRVMPSRAAGGHLLIHLRVGDVIEEQEHSLAEMLNTDVRFNQSGKKYVHRLDYYRSLDVARMNVTRAVIVAGSHLPYASFNRSCFYVHTVRKMLQSKGVEVDLRCGRDPDDDVVAASRAKWISAASGGFSNLLKIIATSFGAREAPHVATLRNSTLVTYT